MPQFNETIQVITSSEIRSRHIASARQAEQVFGADLAITGSVQKEKNKIRLILNLVDTKSLRQISSSIEEYNIANVYSFQDDVVTKVSKMMEVKLKPEQLRRINSGGTNDPDAYMSYTKGRGYLQKYWNKKNVDSAIYYFKNALNKDSEYVLAIAALGEAYSQKFQNENDAKWIDSALISSKHAVALNEALPVVRVTSGIILNELGQYEKAILEFKQAIEEDKYNFDGYNSLAFSYQSLNRYKEAEETYKRSINLKPAFWVGYNKLGIFYCNSGKYNDAVQQFIKVVELTPENTFGLDNLGGMYFYLEKWSEAKSIFENVIKLKPDYAAYSNLGSIYFFHDENYVNAGNMYKKALALDSSNYVLWGNLAAVYYQLPGDKNTAIKYFNRASKMAEEKLKINPNDAGTLSLLASYYSVLNRKKKSIQYLNKALKIAPDGLDIKEKCIESYETLGKRDEALKLTEGILTKGFPISKLERTPDLKDMIKDRRFELLKKKFSN
jgi:tetratricopeptide (TPR) repeat protein